VQPVPRRGLLGDRHPDGTGRDGRDLPGDGLDVARQLAAVDHLKLWVVPDWQARRPGGDVMYRGGQAAPAARAERHGVGQADTDLGGGGRQVVFGEGRLAGVGLGEPVPARTNLDGRAQRPGPGQRLLQGLGPQAQAYRWPGHGGEHARARQQSQRDRAAGRGAHDPATPPVPVSSPDNPTIQPGSRGRKCDQGICCLTVSSLPSLPSLPSCRAGVRRWPARGAGRPDSGSPARTCRRPAGCR
jgi:hypothetical protein